MLFWTLHVVSLILSRACIRKMINCLDIFTKSCNLQVTQFKEHCDYEIHLLKYLYLGTLLTFIAHFE